MTNRLNVNINDETYQVIHLARLQQGQSATETIRRAVSMYEWVRVEQSVGNRILSKAPDGTIREVVFS